MLAIESGEKPPTSTKTLVDMTKSYKNVPNTFWPA
jgi:hypothetical protein